MPDWTQDGKAAAESPTATGRYDDGAAFAAAKRTVLERWDELNGAGEAMGSAYDEFAAAFERLSDAVPGHDPRLALRLNALRDAWDEYFEAQQRFLMANTALRVCMLDMLTGHLA